MSLSPYQNLANEIVLRAVEDYRLLLNGESAQKVCDSKRSLEKFFRSPWFATLTGVDGEVLLEKLKKENS